MKITNNLLRLIDVVNHYSNLTTISSIYIPNNISQSTNQIFNTLPRLTNIYYLSFFDSIDMLDYGFFNHIILPEDQWDAYNIEVDAYNIEVILGQILTSEEEFSFTPNTDKNFMHLYIDIF